MGRLKVTGAMPYWLIVAPLLVLVVLGPRGTAAQSDNPSRLRSIRRRNTSMMRR